MIKELLETSHLFAGNAPFVEGLFEDYQRDPASVPDEWRIYFDQLLGQVAKPAARATPAPAARVAPSAKRPAFETVVVSPSGDELAMVPAEKQSGVRQLIMSYRILGHMMADLDPLRLEEKEAVRALQLSEHRLSADDLDIVFDAGNMWGLKDATLRRILEALQETYTRHVAVEYTHISNLDQRDWIRERLERTRAKALLSPEQKKLLLRRVTAAETMERFIHNRYTGQKRFSLEGGESLIPLLDTLIDRCANTGAKEITIGMAHRGRLNVLVNIMGKAPHELFMQFEGKFSATPGSGDVKYHEGYSSNMHTQAGPLHLTLAFNPSHLEIVGPVVEGSVRARQERRGDRSRKQVIPIIIHGDAAIAGQGVVYETFNLAQTRGFTTGGSIHIVVNNQIGFTLSNPLDTRSTLYCTDIAKVVQAPIFHVNGDDPEAVAFVGRLAADFRQTFNKDVMIDLVCYRRHGHNEADEPAATQPVMYAKIHQHPTTREIYARQLVDERICTPDEPDQFIADYRKELEEGERLGLHIEDEGAYPFIGHWSRYLNRSWDTPANTAVRLETLREVGHLLTAIPEGFQLHPRVAKIVDDRRKMIAGALPIDWGCAENLAYATILHDGFKVRLTGQDSGRGTFFHRHAVFYCNQTGRVHIPLHTIAKDESRLTIVDSILSEEAVLAFEYGYSTTNPDVLVIWEAQFGDFANVAQVVIDQFLSSSEQKWHRLCGMVMLLPHGWEGQGPEHSSARLERFMQLCAEDNLQVVNPTTPAQMFHLLRREMIRPYRKPLIVMSPKSTLRRKTSFSSLDDLVQGEFRPVLGERDDLNAEGVQRVIICSGKVYYDIYEERARRGTDTVVLLRLEQLYPFPTDLLTAELKRYEHVSDVVWCQEEPRNQGAWYSIQHRLHRCLQPNQILSIVGRPPSASPAVGDSRRHREHQEQLVDDALRLEPSSAVRILSTQEPSQIAAN